MLFTHLTLHTNIILFVIVTRLVIVSCINGSNLQIQFQNYQHSKVSFETVCLSKMNKIIGFKNSYRTHSVTIDQLHLNYVIYLPNSCYTFFIKYIYSYIMYII